MQSIYDQDMPRNEANFTPMCPLSFIERTAEVYPNRLAVLHGPLRQTWPDLCPRAPAGQRLAARRHWQERHRGCDAAQHATNGGGALWRAMAGAVFNALNTRLDPEAIAFMLDHGQAKAVIVDSKFAGTMAKALKRARPSRCCC